MRVPFKVFRISELNGHDVYAAILLIGSMAAIWGGAAGVLLFELLLGR
jgi:hypothetical protein